MLGRLKHALLSENIHLKYQPVYSLSHEEVVGFEALLRWRDPHYGSVCPETLVTLAAQHGLMNTVSVYVIKKALSQMVHLIKAHHLFLSFNLHPTDFLSHSFKDFLYSALARHQLTASDLMLEITEVPCHDLSALNQNAQLLAEKGFRLALDDFGKGCSDSERLRALPVTDVKIDRLLTHALCEGLGNGHGSDAQKHCDSLYRFPYPLIFEGVETQAQLTCLRERFPRARVQGWYFSKAVPIEGVRRLLGESVA